MTIHRQSVRCVYDSGKNKYPAIASVLGEWLEKYYPDRKTDIGIDIIYCDYQEKDCCCILFSKSKEMLYKFISDWKLEMCIDNHKERCCNVSGECCKGCEKNP